MKTSNLRLSMLIAGIVISMSGMLASCSKKSSGPSGPTAPAPPSNPGGYDSANQIQPDALVAYWSFDGNFNETKNNLTATASGAPTFASGVKGQGYQGNGSSYLVVPFGSSASLFAGASFPSFTVSFWIKEPQEPLYVPASDPQVYTPGLGPEGLLFMYDAAGHQDLLHIDIEPHANDSLTQDTLNLNAGFTITGATTTGPYVGGGGVEGVVPNAHLDTAINKWVQIVMTYNGPGSAYTLYQDGTAVNVNSAWSTYAAGPSPVPILTGGTGVAGAVALGPLNFTPAPTGLVIGAWAGTANVGGFTPNQYSGSFKGIMDELRIYNVALNASDVKSLYLLEQSGF